jgi:hypothetical protein
MSKQTTKQTVADNAVAEAEAVLAKFEKVKAALLAEQTALGSILLRCP